MAGNEPGYTEAAMRASAKTMRQIYVALIAEGFTADQSIELVKALLPRAN